MGNWECKPCTPRDRGIQDADEPTAIVASNDMPFVSSTDTLKGNEDLRHKLDHFSKEVSGFVSCDDEGFEDVTPKNVQSENEASADTISGLDVEDTQTMIRQVSISSTSYSRSALESRDLENVKADKLARLASQRGFFVALDRSTDNVLLKQLQMDARTRSHGDIKEQAHALHERIVTSPKFEASKVLGVFIPPDSVERHVGQVQLVKYLSQEKKIVTLLNLGNCLKPQCDGVQLIEVEQSFEDILQHAVSSGVVGVKISSVVKQCNTEGIAALVEQQFSLAKGIMATGLLPVLHISVDIRASDKSQLSKEAALTERHRCEQILFDQLLAALSHLRPNQRVMFDLSLPAKPNTYLPLVGHPNTVRVLGAAGQHSFQRACKVLEQNFALVASFGSIFVDGMSPLQGVSDFTSILEKTIEKVYQASIAVPSKEMQTTKVANTPGFFACLDSAEADIDKALQRYRLGSRSAYASEEEALDSLHKMRSRIFTSTKFSGSRVIGVMMSEHTMERSVQSKPSAKYLWENKQIVPFLTLETGLRVAKDGVQVPKDHPKLEQVLSKAVEAGIYGVKAKSLITKPNVTGIETVVSHHLLLSQKIMEKELVPVLHIEVDKGATDKAECEQLLLIALGKSLNQLRPEQMVMIWISPPAIENRYLPLLGHPNVIRIVAVSGGNDRAQSCIALQHNYGLIGGFNRGFVEGMHAEQTDEELDALVDSSCQAIFDSSRDVALRTIQKYKAAKQDGFFAALAHLASRTEFSIAAQVNYGMSHEAEGMQPVFERIVTNPQFNSLSVIGVSLTAEHLDMQVMGMPIAKYICEEKQFVPFLKIDVYGLREERDGVQLMQELEKGEMDSLLDMAVNAGIFGTTSLSKIRLPNSKGIHDVVDQAISWAKTIISKGLVPVLMLFIDKDDAPEKEKCERILRTVLIKQLRKLDENEFVMLNFILPSSSGFYDCFVTHPQVLRVMGSAGSYTLEECCRMLSENPGIAGNFGTAILRNLNSGQTYAAFTEAIGKACSEVHKAVRRASKNRPDAAGSRLSSLSTLEAELPVSP